MSSVGMHPGEVHTDESIVRRLLETQFTQWANLPLERVASAGTDNALYRLGDEMVVRLPRIDWAVEMVDKEYEWLPTLASRLPLPVHLPLAKGVPGAGYPWNWTICRWLNGENATLDRIGDLARFASDLGRFVTALQRIDATDGPPPGSHNVGRGVPLSNRDANTRRAISELGGMIDVAAATVAWEAALSAPVWDGPPTWIHGDLQSGNLLVRDGRRPRLRHDGRLDAPNARFPRHVPDRRRRR